jgi:hypothetical protein
VPIEEEEEEAHKFSRQEHLTPGIWAPQRYGKYPVDITAVELWS